MQRLGLARDALVIDQTPPAALAQRLSEAHISCLTEDKDLYLYYFIFRYPGRTLIFANSIDCIRRLVSLLTLLQLEPLRLHAGMQQRQRLKNLDRFRANPRAVLVSSDVAARGLDIPGVQHVVHYQLPRTAELYVHRCGRTARAHCDGISVALIGPDDMPAYKRICRDLHKSNGLPDFPLDLLDVRALRKRLLLARRIDKEQHRVDKASREHNWFRRAAAAADLVLDTDLVNGLHRSRTESLNGDVDGAEEEMVVKKKKKQQQQREDHANTAAADGGAHARRAVEREQAALRQRMGPLKAALKELLATPLPSARTGSVH